MEKERDLTERQLVVEVEAGAAGWGRGGRQHLGKELRACDRQQSLGASLSPFLRKSKSRRPTSPKAPVWPPWYSPPVSASSSEDRPQPRLARRELWVFPGGGGPARVVLRGGAAVGV
jgi:hypothetical protein